MFGKLKTAICYYLFLQVRNAYESNQTLESVLFSTKRNPLETKMRFIVVDKQKRELTLFSVSYNEENGDVRFVLQDNETNRVYTDIALLEKELRLITQKRTEQLVTYTKRRSNS